MMSRYVVRFTLFAKAIVLVSVLLSVTSCPGGGTNNGTCQMCNPDVIRAYNAQRTGTLTEVYVENCSSERVDFNIYVPGAGWGTGVWLDPQEYMKYQYPGWSGTWKIQWREWPSGNYMGQVGSQTLGPGDAAFFTWCGE